MQLPRHIGVRNVSHFTVGRPPIPWALADLIANTLDKHHCDTVGIGGSMHPSILVACGFERPDRELNAWATRSMWNEAICWNLNKEDSEPPEDDDWPWANTALPLNDKNVRFPEGASAMLRGAALFLDLPFYSELLQLDLSALDRWGWEDKLLLLGFLEGHDGPDDVLEWSKQKDHLHEEFCYVITNTEARTTLEYKLIIATPRKWHCEPSLPY